LPLQALAFAYLSSNICLGIPFLELAGIPNPIEAKTSVENSSAKVVVQDSSDGEEEKQKEIFMSNVLVQTLPCKVMK
jgi:hypothetical protein